MSKRESATNLASLARKYLASQLTRHPERYVEIVQILRKYQLLHLALQPGFLSHDEQDKSLLTRFKGQEEHVLYARNLVLALEELGPCFIKLGQLMSTRSDLFPSPYIEELSRLQDTITPVPGDVITEIIERDLGEPLSELFQSFQYEPLATASIAQVHAAVLHDGSEVAIKVQRPGVHRQVEIDIDVMQEVARFATHYTPYGSRFGLMHFVQELKQSLSQELDFLQEAENTRIISRALRSFKYLTIPVVHRQYTSCRVLTLSFIHGAHLSHVSDERLKQSNANNIAKELLTAYLKQMIIDGVFHCDPHPGNILFTDEGQLALLDFGMVGRFDAGQKDCLVHLLLAFSECQGERVAETYLEMVETPEGFDRRGFVQGISAVVSRYHTMGEGMDIGSALLSLATVAQSYRTSVPAPLTLLGKAMLNLNSTLNVLEPELSPIQIIRNFMLDVMEQQLQDQMSPGRLYGWFLDTRHLLGNMARRTETIIDKIAHDQLTLHVKVDNVDYVIQKAAKRISFGMILSSVIISIGLFFRRS